MNEFSKLDALKAKLDEYHPLDAQVEKSFTPYCWALNIEAEITNDLEKLEHEA